MDGTSGGNRGRPRGDLTFAPLESQKCPKSSFVWFPPRKFNGLSQLGGNVELKRATSTDRGVGSYPRSRISDGFGVTRMIYSAAIQHIGLFQTRTTESSGSRGLGLTVWITRARQGWGFESLPVRAVPGCKRWGTHLGGAGHLLAHGGLAIPPGSSTPELTPKLRLGRAVSEPTSVLIEFRELPPTEKADRAPVPDGGFRND